MVISPGLWISKHSGFVPNTSDLSQTLSGSVPNTSDLPQTLSGSVPNTSDLSQTLSGSVLAGSPSRGGDVAVYVFDINLSSVPTPFCSVLVSVAVFVSLSTVFRAFFVLSTIYL